MLDYQVDFSHWHASDLEPDGYQPKQVVYNSRVLELVSNSLLRQSKASVLHLGRINPELIELIDRSKSKLINLEPGTEAGDFIFKYLSESPRRFNTIFLWDFLLYLDEKKLNEVVSVINRCSSMGTSLIFLTSTRNSIPELPSRVRILDDNQIEITPTSTKIIHTKIFEIKKQFQAWNCMRSTQLKNGFREHLLVKNV